MDAMASAVAVMFFGGYLNGVVLGKRFSSMAPNPEGVVHANR